MIRLVEECQREWDRLGLAAEVIDDLTAQLEQAIEQADGEIPPTIRGISTADPQALAVALARARPIRRPRLQYTGGGGQRPGLKSGVLVLLLLFAIGGVAAVLEFRSPSEQESGPVGGTTVQTQTAQDLATVPSLLGLSTQDATSAAQAAGVRIGDTEAVSRPGTVPGTVIRESPVAGTRIPRGTTLTLVVTK
ncbi:MAG: PASTA domain-containing protein [Gaiellales bacterium]